MGKYDWNHIVNEGRVGNEAPFNALLQPLYDADFKWQLLKVTQSEEMAFEVFLNAMTKFWERFILKKEHLPKGNIKGYIHNMARNNFLDLKRKDNRKSNLKTVELDDTLLGFSAKGLSEENMYVNRQESVDGQTSENRKLRSLSTAIGKLCDDCKTLIERNVFEGEKLKSLKIEMGYTGSYQAIVEKKKRCIKKLTKLFFVELNQMKGVE